MDIKTFSSHIGLSPTTISQALNGKRPVKASTRQMILQKMAELGYTPNVNARRLVSKETHLMAFYSFSSATSLPLEDPYQLVLLRYLGMEMRRYGYDLLLDFSPAEIDSRYESLLGRVQSNAIDGTFLIGSPRPVERLKMVATANCPCVVLDNQKRTPMEHVAFITVSSEQAYRKIFTQLAAVGRRRILYLGREQDDHIISLCQRIALENKLPPLEFIYTEESVADVRNLFRTIFSREADARPQAVLARTDPQGQGAYLAALDAGLNVPADISIVSHSNCRADGFTPVLANINYDHSTACRMAFSTLLTLRKHPDFMPSDDMVIHERFSHCETFL